MKISFVLLALLISPLWISCGRKGTLPTTAPNLAAKAGQILPKPGSDGVDADASLRLFNLYGVRTNPSWFVEGWYGYELFRLLADPEVWDPDQSLWGTENILNNIKLAALVVENAAVPREADTQTVPLGPETLSLRSSVATASSALTTTFAAGFDYTSPTYESQRTVEINDQIQFALAWTNRQNLFALLSSETRTHGYGHWQGHFHNGTKDLVLNHALFSQRGRNDAFLMRLEMSGNTSTATFQLRTLKRSIGPSGKILAILAAGTASETVATNHYIVKVQAVESADRFAEQTPITAYFCVLASVDNGDFNNFYLSTAGSNTAEYIGTSNKIEFATSPSRFSNPICQESALTAVVDAMTFFTEEDLPATESSYSQPLF